MAAAIATYVPLDQLANATTFWDSVADYRSGLIVFIGHCLFCASLAPEFKSKYLVHYMLTHLWGFGGGILTTMLIMDPKVAPHAILADNMVGIVWTICWWLVTYAPGGYLEKLHNVWVIKMSTKACTSLLRVRLIIARVDLAVAMYPGVVAAPLLLGTVAGCGGRLLADLVMWGWTPPNSSLSNSAELSNPAWVSRSALMASAIYYLGAHHWRLVPAEALAGLIITLKMVHSFATDLAGQPLDYTSPLSAVLLKLTNIPDPAAPAKGAKAPKAAVAAAAAPAKRATAATSADNGSAGAVSTATTSTAVRRSTRNRPVAA